MHSIEVKNEQFIQLESIGMRDKYWIDHDNSTAIFKKNLRDTGEDWAEVLASKICAITLLPHARYLFAHSIDSVGSRERAVISPNMLSDNEELTLGNQLLFEKDKNYPADGGYKVSEHSIESVSIALDAVLPPIISIHQNRSAIEHFAGYLLLDVLIGNQDRHHQNWGAIRNGEKHFLAPTFDHASSFAQNITEDERLNRLNTSDIGYSIKAFSAKAKSALYCGQSEKILTTRDAYSKFCHRNKVPVSSWKPQFELITPDVISDIVKSIPERYLSEINSEFTKTYLNENLEFINNEYFK